MPTTPATARTTACRQPPFAQAADQPPATRIWDHSSSRVMGTITQLIQVRTRLVPAWSSEVTTL